MRKHRGHFTKQTLSCNLLYRVSTLKNLQRMVTLHWFVCEMIVLFLLEPWSVLLYVLVGIFLPETVIVFFKIHIIFCDYCIDSNIHDRWGIWFCCSRTNWLDHYRTQRIHLRRYQWYVIHKNWKFKWFFLVKCAHHCHSGIVIDDGQWVFADIYNTSSWIRPWNYGTCTSLFFQQVWWNN